MPSFYLPEIDAVFLHNPKTAGRLIRICLWNKDVKGPFQSFIPKIYEEKFKFCFVRNPYDRLVSSWKHCLNSLKSNSKLKNLKLQDFFHIAKDNLYINDWQNTYFNRQNGETQSFAMHHSLPQTDAFYMLDQADFCGRFENLQNDLNNICKILNIEKTIIPDVPQFKTKHGHFSEYFIDKTFLNQVNEYYKKDFEIFNYQIMN